MPLPSRHRLGSPRSASSSKGDKPLSMHRGAEPQGSGARMSQSGAPTRSGKTRFLSSSKTPKSDAPRALLAPPKKQPKPKAPLPPPKPRVMRAPAPAQERPAPRPRTIPRLALVAATPEAPVIERRVSPVQALTNADRERIFGKFKFEAAPSPGNPERIRVEQAWVARNITSVKVPALDARVAKKDPLALGSAPLVGLTGWSLQGAEFNRLVAPHFEMLIAAWDAAGLLSLIKTWNGSYVPRFRRGQADKKVLSAHSWGTAFDINARWNGFRQQPAALGEEGSVFALVDIANEHGWMWGGDFLSPDGMHFEAGEKLFSRSK